MQVEQEREPSPPPLIFDVSVIWKSGKRIIRNSNKQNNKEQSTNSGWTFVYIYSWSRGILLLIKDTSVFEYTMNLIIKKSPIRLLNIQQRNWICRNNGRETMLWVFNFTPPTIFHLKTNYYCNKAIHSLQFLISHDENVERGSKKLNLSYLKTFVKALSIFITWSFPSSTTCRM